MFGWFRKYRVSDRIKGCLYGQAIGDALGLGTEFMTREEVRKHYPHGLTDYGQIIQDRHRSRWKPGDWTDDTDMMLCIANAIIDDKGVVDVMHVARNFKAWYNGEPMGIGAHTYKVLGLQDYVEDPIKAAEIIWQSSRGKSAANGALMRTSILGILGDLQNDVEKVCRLTHADPRCVGSCAIASKLIHHLVFHKNLLPLEHVMDVGDCYDERIREYLLSLDMNGIEGLRLDDTADMGYTLKTLSAGLWALYHADSFEEGLLAIVNAGGDADTNAAVACSMLGARFGFRSIPKKYVKGLNNEFLLSVISQRVIELAM